MTARQALAPIATLGAIAVGTLVLAVGLQFVGPTWHVYGQETMQTTPAQEQHAMRCAPLLSAFDVLESDPATIDIVVHGSSARANRIAQCLDHQPGISDAGAIKSQ